MSLLKNPILQKTEELELLCQEHNVSDLYLFGSVLTEKFKDSSDVDILVTFQKMNLRSYAHNFFNLKQKLEILLERNIDLVESQTLRNPVLIRTINRNKQLIYG